MGMWLHGSEHDSECTDVLQTKGKLTAWKYPAHRPILTIWSCIGPRPIAVQRCLIHSDLQRQQNMGIVMEDMWAGGLSKDWWDQWMWANRMQRYFGYTIKFEAWWSVIECRVLWKSDLTWDVMKYVQMLLEHVTRGHAQPKMDQDWDARAWLQLMCCTHSVIPPYNFGNGYQPKAEITKYEPGPWGYSSPYHHWFTYRFSGGFYRKERARDRGTHDRGTHYKGQKGGS
jgi:hypothetical protein